MDLRPDGVHRQDGMPGIQGPQKHESETSPESSSRYRGKGKTRIPEDRRGDQQCRNRVRI